MSEPDLQLHHLIAVELDDAVGPRRRPDRPNLRLDITTMDPRARYELLRSKGRGVVGQYGRRLRLDLTRNYQPSDAAEARRQRTKLRDKLQRRGFTVNGDRRVWRLYVVELDDSVGPRADPSFPWIYVGETSLDVEARIEQHRSGARNGRGRLYSPVVFRHYTRARPDLYADEPVLYSAADAKLAEARLAERLRQQGFSVKGGH